MYNTKQESIYKRSIRSPTVDGNYKAEGTLKYYAEVHLKSKNERFIDSANRILLVLGTSSLCAADLSYHKSYESFNSPWWKSNTVEPLIAAIFGDQA